MKIYHLRIAIALITPWQYAEKFNYEMYICNGFDHGMFKAVTCQPVTVVAPWRPP